MVIGYKFDDVYPSKLDEVIDYVEDELVRSTELTGIDYTAVYYLNDNGTIYADVFEELIESDEFPTN